MALLIQEGSVIAFFAMTRGVVPNRNVSECILIECSFGTTPALRATPPDSGELFGKPRVFGVLHLLLLFHALKQDRRSRIVVERDCFGRRVCCDFGIEG